MLTYKIYNSLPEEARRIRQEVFVEEQGFQNEFDERDIEATHIVVYDDGKPVATCRFYLQDGVHSSDSISSLDGASSTCDLLSSDVVSSACDNSSAVIGRVAVLKSCRGKNVGSQMLAYAEDQIRKMGASEIAVNAQTRAMGFYESVGFISSCLENMDEGVPHIWMYKPLLIH